MLNSSNILSTNMKNRFFFGTMIAYILCVKDQSPFDEWLNDIDSNTTALRLEAFYNEPEKYFRKNTDWFFRAKNHMFFDIGYDVSNADENFIKSRIEEMDHIFELVLLTDYFDESLIMMKHALCWDWDDIIYVKFKMRISEAKTEVNEDLAGKILRWNHADDLLYDHFNRTFWDKVSEYGYDRMEKDLAMFRQRQKAAEELCIESYEPFKKKPWVLGARIRKPPTPYCRSLAASETVYGEILREKMYNAFPQSKLSETQLAERENLFNEVQSKSYRAD